LKAKIDESTEADFKSERLGKNLFQVHWVFCEFAKIVIPPFCLGLVSAAQIYGSNFSQMCETRPFLNYVWI
jgi:hypothetical protein